MRLRRLTTSFLGLVVVAVASLNQQPAGAQPPGYVGSFAGGYSYQESHHSRILPSAGQTVQAPVAGMFAPTEMIFESGDSTAPFTAALGINSYVTEPFLDFQNRQSDKELMLLVPTGQSTCGPSITVGGQMRVSAMAATVSRANKFSYLGRFPPDFVGNHATDARITHANAAAVIHFTPWAHGYAETLFSDVFTFPDFKQGSFQVRQAYVAFGDLTQTPWYAFIGKKNISFGDMGTLSPYSQSVVWHYFAPLAEGAGVGYAANGLNASITALNGSRGIRVTDSETRGNLNNFAANARYEVPVDDQSWVAFGAGYLHGTIYDAATAEHTNPQITGPRNGAWDVNVAAKIGQWRAEYEVATTLKAWPATGSQVTAYRTELAYDMLLMNDPFRISGSWSEGRQGPGDSQFEYNRQLIAGLRYDPHPNVMISLEYIRSTGFAPLINITTVSDKDASQDTILLGVVLNI